MAQVDAEIFISKEALDPQPPPHTPPRRSAPYAVGGAFIHEGQRALSKCGTFTSEEQVDAYNFAMSQGSKGLVRARGVGHILEQGPAVKGTIPRTSAMTVGEKSCDHRAAWDLSRTTAVANNVRDTRARTAPGGAATAHSPPQEKAQGGGNPAKWGVDGRKASPVLTGRGAGSQQRNNNQVRPTPPRRAPSARPPRRRCTTSSTTRRRSSRPRCW